MHVIYNAAFKKDMLYLAHHKYKYKFTLKQLQIILEKILHNSGTNSTRGNKNIKHYHSQKETNMK